MVKSILHQYNLSTHTHLPENELTRVPILGDCYFYLVTIYQKIIFLLLFHIKSQLLYVSKVSLNQK